MNYQLEIEVDVPRDQLVKLFADPDTLPYWQPGFISIKHLDGEEDKPGARYSLMYKHGKGEMEMVETVEVYDFPGRYKASYVAKGMVMTVDNRLEEIDDGKRTKWTTDNDAQTRGFVMKIFSIIMPGCFKKESLKYMENLKAYAEEGKDIRSETDKADC